MQGSYEMHYIRTWIVADFYPYQQRYRNVLLY